MANCGSKLWLGDQEALTGDYHILEPVPAIYATDGQANAAFSNEVALTLASTNEQPYVAHSLRAEGFDASEDGTGRGTPLVPIAFTGGASDILTEENLAQPVTGRNGDPGMVAFGIGPDAVDRSGEGDGSAAQRAGLNIVEGLQSALRARPNNSVAHGWAVRRLMPVECERLMGFPDGYTAITYRGKPAADGPRYKALGNSWAVNVFRWVGRRIEMVERIAADLERERAA